MHNNPFLIVRPLTPRGPGNYKLADDELAERIRIETTRSDGEFVLTDSDEIAQHRAHIGRKDGRR